MNELEDLVERYADLGDKYAAMIKDARMIPVYLAADKERWVFEYSSYWQKRSHTRKLRRLEAKNRLQCSWPWRICDEPASRHIRWEVLGEYESKRWFLCADHDELIDRTSHPITPECDDNKCLEPPCE